MGPKFDLRMFGRENVIDEIQPLNSNGARSGAVVEALSYKPEGCGIDSRWCHCNFSLT
jgi:hypothetical protein